ncbi:hypothetical protein D2T31_04880 [Sinirhodobacter populi]|uniref:Uncharacterized protein n=1 Tax=Paenirhodobacter populi TaxID=2306993 RepID=A0A443KF60_9RHOB|nr:hypothetical protein [Sinirhodobacter populi]RWR31336.1 hypothetical protein D2T31_04880 [Sinirhodobacter populi]
MSAGTLSGDRLPQTIMVAEGTPRIVIEIRNKDPIDLLDFSAQLTGIAREHEARMRADHPGIDVDETRLLVVDVRKGSIIMELLPVLAPIVATVDYANTVIDFVKHMQAGLSALIPSGGRLENATTQQLKNFGDTVHAIAQDSDGQLHIAARHQNGDVIQEFVVSRSDAKAIEVNATAQRKELQRPGQNIYHRVLMRLHQSSVEDLKVGKRTSEKGIVERIDDVPRTLIYASDLAGQRIKDEILKPDGNPFQKGFIVDLDVETVGGRPKLYRIMEVHDVIDLEEE